MPFYRKSPLAFQEFFQRLWHSPTFTTWVSYGTRSFNFIFVFPLLLTRLSTEEIAIWYLFKSILDLQFVMDMGLNATFTRYSAYLTGSSNIPEINRTTDKMNFQSLLETMNVVYLCLSTATILLFSIPITKSLERPISFLENPQPAWTAWIIILITLFININGMKYGSFLQGINQISIYRRWEAFTNLGSIISNFIILLFRGNLLILVISQQAWNLLSVYINRHLAKETGKTYLRSINSFHYHKDVFKAIWPTGWRSGLGQFMSYGVTQISGIIYAQFGSATDIASYLLGLRLIQQIAAFSRAPFYSKLPTIYGLFAKEKINEMLKVAKKGMSLSYWTYGILFIILGIIGEPLLHFIGSNASFVPSKLWALLGIGFFLERFGAHHIQLYSATNKIIWHIANGITGTIFIASSIIAFPILSVYSFPMAYIVGYSGFYVWYSAMHSYREFKMNFFKFEPFSFWLAQSALFIYLFASFQ